MHSTVNEFIMLANKQFFENRVYDDDDTVDDDEAEMEVSRTSMRPETGTLFATTFHNLSAHVWLLRPYYLYVNALFVRDACSAGPKRSAVLVRRGEPPVHSRRRWGINERLILPFV